MSDAAQSNQQQLKSLITVFLGTNLIFWILSIFIIVQVYDINATLKGIKEQMTFQAAANTQLSNFQIVDADGKVVYSFQQVQMPYDEMNGIGPDGLPMPGMHTGMAPSSTTAVPTPVVTPVTTPETAPDAMK